MATLTAAPPSQARQIAAKCARANHAAMRPSHSRYGSDTTPQTLAHAEFVFARDGALTALVDGAWLSGCSMPRAVAAQLLASLDLRSTVGCFLNPTHAAQIRCVLDRLSPTQALIAVVLEEPTLAWMLQCEDFSRELDSHRLWLVAGDDWAEQLSQLLQEHPGLPVPGQFIRTSLTHADQLKELIETAQGVLSEQTRRRESRMAELGGVQEHPASKTAPWCVVAGSHFHLWNGAATALWQSLSSSSDAQPCVHFDCDDPISAAPLALAEQAAQSRGIITANLARVDFSPMMSLEKPWVTWVTGGRIPPAASAGPNDRLLIADPRWVDSAMQAGWTQDRVKIALWPHASQSSPPAACLGLLADTRTVNPEPEMELSSHRLLWQAIYRELSADPSVLTGEPLEYLRRHRTRMNISEQGFDTTRFIHELIVPAYQQSLAILLHQAGLPLRLWGKGWDAIESLSPCWAGPADTQETFAAALRQISVLVQPWPGGQPSALGELHALGKPVLNTAVPSRQILVRQAKSLLSNPPSPPHPTQAVLSASLLDEWF